MAECVVVQPGEGKTIRGPVGGALNFKVRGDQTGGALTALENVIPPGEGPPLHVHANEDEFWFLIEGDLRFTLGEEVRQPPRGRSSSCRAGCPTTSTTRGTERPASS